MNNITYKRFTNIVNNKNLLVTSLCNYVDDKIMISNHNLVSCFKNKNDILIEKDDLKESSFSLHVSRDGIEPSIVRIYTFSDIFEFEVQNKDKSSWQND